MQGRLFRVVMNLGKHLAIEILDDNRTHHLIKPRDIPYGPIEPVEQNRAEQKQINTPQFLLQPNSYGSH